MLYKMGDNNRKKGFTEQGPGTVNSRDITTGFT